MRIAGGDMTLRKTKEGLVSSIEQVQFAGVGHSLGAATDVEFAKYILHMCFDSVDAHKKCQGYFLIRLSLGD